MVDLKYKNLANLHLGIAESKLLTIHWHSASVQTIIVLGKLDSAAVVLFCTVMFVSYLWLTHILQYVCTPFLLYITLNEYDYVTYKKFTNLVVSGEFGVVYRARLQWHPDAMTEIVAVKTLKGKYF